MHRSIGWVGESIVGLMALGSALLLSVSAGAAEVKAVFDPACLDWNAATYRAEKLFMSVELAVAAQVLEEPPLAALRPVEGRAPLMPGQQTLRLEVTTLGPGWRSLRGELLLDAPTGAILQYASLREPSPRFRVYRFTDTGPQRWTATPRDGELDAPADQWSDVDVRQRTYPLGGPAAGAAGEVRGPVLEVSTLLYLLAASRLGAPGDVLRVLGYATSADELYAVSATVGESIRLAVDYRIEGAGKPASRRAIIAVLPIRVAGLSLAAHGTAEGFDILGLQDVEFLLDPEQRVIVALRARVPAVGGVQFQLRTLGLGASTPARCRADTG